MASELKHQEDQTGEVAVYRQLFLNAGEGMILTNFSGKIVEINPRCLKMFGYKEADLLGERIEVLIPHQYLHNHKNLRNKFRSDPKNRSMGTGMNLSGKKKDGTIFPVEISLNHFGKDKDLKVMALISDISSRVRIERKIKELNEELENKVEERTHELLRSQNLFLAIARNFPGGTISVFDKKLNYIFFEGKELYEAGIESEKLIGTSIKNRLPEDIRSKVIDHLNNVFKGERGNIEFETKSQVFEINAVPLVTPKGSINQILVVERNITNQKRAEHEILNSLTQERALNELKSRFVSMASHEFRTPLSTVLSSISLISKYNNGENEEKVNKHVNRIKSSVHNLTGILNDFLSLDKLEEGKIRLKQSQLLIKDAVDDLIDELEDVLKKGQDINVKYDIDEEMILIDTQILKNILINLTSNAIKYSPENSKIDLFVKIKNSKLTIKVIDQGIGIPKDEQKNMFERFFRAKNATNIGGTGLGLNIVKKYVEFLKGDIKFSSQLNKGTEFIVQLPLDKL